MHLQRHVSGELLRAREALELEISQQRSHVEEVRAPLLGLFGSCRAAVPGL